MYKYVMGIALSCMLCSNTHGQHELSKKRFINWFTQDPVSFVNDLNSKDLVTLGFSGIVFSSLSGFDEPNSFQFRRRYSNSGYLNITNEFGTINLMAPISAFVFGTSLLTKDRHFQDAAFTSLQAVLYNQISVGALKFAFARSRPYENDGPNDFDFFTTGETSFPSGHTSTAFAVITPWIMYYPSAFTYSLLAIPTGTALARIAKGKHWLTDVTFGAAIGAYWGYYLSKKHLSISGGDTIRVEPDFNFQSVGMKLSVSL